MSLLSAGTERCVERLSFLVVSSPNQRSTRFSYEELVGVKCRTNRGCASSQRLIIGVLCVEALSSTKCTARSAGTSRSRVCRNFLNSIARWRECSRPMKLGRQLGVVAWNDQVPLVGCVGAAHASSVAMVSDNDERRQRRVSWRVVALRVASNARARLLASRLRPDPQEFCAAT
jgi:hypothetical protein